MKHQQIEDKARVWIVTRGFDGRLVERLDPAFFAALDTGHSAGEIADAIAVAAGELDVAETRLW